MMTEEEIAKVREKIKSDSTEKLRLALTNLHKSRLMPAALIYPERRAKVAKLILLILEEIDRRRAGPQL